MKVDWDILDNVATFQRGLTYGKDDESGSITSKAVLRSNNIDLVSHKLNFEEIKYLKEDFNIPQERLLKKNSIFICMSNGSSNHIGKVAYVDKDYEFAFGGFMGQITPLGHLEGKYLYYACLSNSFKTFLKTISNGANITNLKFSDLAKYRFPIPPLSEQQSIVAELDLLSDIIDKKKEQLRELDNLAQATFYDMFGDPITNEKGWDKPLLNTFAELINGRAYSQEELLAAGKYVVLRVGNFFSDKNYYYSNLELEADKYCYNGDLLFAWSASFGARIWEGEKTIYHYHIWKVKYDDKQVEKIYLCHLLNSVVSDLRNQMHGIGMIHLTKNGMEKTPFILPPFELQQSFANKIEALQHQKSLLSQSLQETQTLLDATMDKYFG